MKIISRWDEITRHHNRFYARQNDKSSEPNVIKVEKGCSTQYRHCGTASSVSPDCRRRQFIPLRGAGDPPSPQPGEGFFNRSPLRGRILTEFLRSCVEGHAIGADAQIASPFGRGGRRSLTERANKLYFIFLPSHPPPAGALPEGEPLVYPCRFLIRGRIIA